MSLNIDHSLIIVKAEQRSKLLKQLEELLKVEVQTTFTRLQRAEEWMRDLYEVYTLLDTEGKDMLPEVVQRFVQGRHFNSLNTIIEGNGEMFPGLGKVAALFPKSEEWVPEPMHPYDKEADPAAPKIPTMQPEADGNGQHFKLVIQYLFGWDTQAWPEGVWHAQYEGDINYGIGRTPDEAFKHLHNKS